MALEGSAEPYRSDLSVCRYHTAAAADADSTVVSRSVSVRAGDGVCIPRAYRCAGLVDSKYFIDLLNDSKIMLENNN